jgi:hypothetical protein
VTSHTKFQSDLKPKPKPNTAITRLLLIKKKKTITPELMAEYSKGAVPFHFKVPICDLWENGKIYDIDSFRDYICGLKH